MRKRLSECVEWSKDYNGELENSSPVWFVVDQVYAGVYSKDLNIFCMADDKGFNCCDAVCFAPVGASRQIASYPKHGERVAVEIPQLPCIVTGTFNMKYLEEGAVDPIPAIELDPIYDFGDVSGAIAWSKVFAWYVVPEIPSYLCYDKTNIIEVPPQECCEECNENILINNQEDDIIINDEEDISEIASFNKKKESKMSRTVRRLREAAKRYTIQWAVWADEHEDGNEDWVECDPIILTAKNDDEALAFALKMVIAGNSVPENLIFNWGKKDFERAWTDVITEDSETIVSFIDDFISAESKIFSIELQTNHGTANLIIDNVKGPNGIIYEFGNLNYLG